jgi:hypothetical protein
MRVSPLSKAGVIAAAICLYASGQTNQGKEAPTEVKGMPPRAAPTDYQAHAQAGAAALAAEFTGHSIATPQGALSTEEYVVVELGLFGSPGTRTQLSASDFTLRINGKKPLPSQPFGLVLATVKDPEWEPPAPTAPKSKTSMSGGGRGEQSDPNTPPAPVPVPFGVQRAMAQRVQKAALPEGDRALPQAGLIFFQYRGQAKGIHSIELIYSGAAGKATLALRP